MLAMSLFVYLLSIKLALRGIFARSVWTAILMRANEKSAALLYDNKYHIYYDKCSFDYNNYRHIFRMC